MVRRTSLSSQIQSSSMLSAQINASDTFWNMDFVELKGQLFR